MRPFCSATLRKAIGISFATLSVAMMSCVVTEKGEIPEIPDYPPAISSAPSVNECIRPTGKIIEYSVPTLDVRPTFCLGAEVLEPNLGQVLHARLFVNTKISETQQNKDESYVRLVEFTNLENVFEVGECYKLEILVTSAFADGAGDQGRVPERANDIAAATWWVFATSEDSPTVDVNKCEALQSTSKASR